MLFLQDGCIIEKPQFKGLNRPQHGKATHSKKYIVEYTVNNCSIPTSGEYFIKCIKDLTGKDYTEEFVTFIQEEKK